MKHPELIADLNSPILSVRDLRVRFAHQNIIEVIKKISFDVNSNETLAVVGESGSGKSVTALAVMGLLNQRHASVEGQLQFLGNDLLKLTPDAMRIKRGKEISMIFQEPMTSLNPLMTIGRQISEILCYHKQLPHAEAWKEAEMLLDRVHIPSAKSRMNDYPHQFSGGMRQRVMIASAIACRPRLLIADEPTTALDVTIQAEVLGLLRELQTEFNMSIMFITHDMGVVAEIADRVLVMYRGNVVEHASANDIFTNQQHPYTRSLLKSVPLLGSMKGSSKLKYLPQVDLATGEVAASEEITNPIDRSSSPVLDVKNLSVRFKVRSGILSRVKGQVHAVENIGFQIFKGETLSIVGESGSGKSTTGRAVMKLVHAEKGQIILNGTDVSTLSPKKFLEHRRAIQMIFQDPYASLDPTQTIIKSIIEPIVVHRTMNIKDAHQKGIELLVKVGLTPNMADRYPHQLSGGQRQRVCIARALSLNPQLIIADEAVAALDVSVRALVINLMLELQKELNLSYLFISHDMAVVERISHRVAVMYLGEIVEIGSRANIFENPQHPYTRKLISAVPIPDPSKKAQRAVVPYEKTNSPIKALNYTPIHRSMHEVCEGHFVQSLS